MAKHRYKKQRIKSNPKQPLTLRLWATTLTPKQRRSIIRKVAKMLKMLKIGKNRQNRFF